MKKDENTTPSNVKDTKSDSKQGKNKKTQKKMDEEGLDDGRFAAFLVFPLFHNKTSFLEEKYPYYQYASSHTNYSISCTFFLTI